MHTDQQQMTGITREAWKTGHHMQNTCHVLLALGMVLALTVEASRSRRTPPQSD
jgi:hypothetical protein